MRFYYVLTIAFCNLALSGCTAIENDLGRGLAYGMDSQTLTRKVDENSTRKKSSAGVNAYLWRASLDVLKGVPLIVADPGKGMILTEWYSPPTDGDNRQQMQIEVLDRDLRPDTLRISVVRQIRQQGAWVNAPGLASSAQTMEENVIKRARDIRGW